MDKSQQVLSPAEWQSVSDYAAELSRRVVESSKDCESKAKSSQPITTCQQPHMD